ncbi:hypothetical protein K2X33_10305 [bacterium]|nr:hypothetical protein [bacterium]
MNSLDACLRSYFTRGLFFLPYLALYLAFWYAEWPVLTLRHAFWGLHAAHLAGAAYTWRAWRPNSDALFWVALGAFFFFPGPYLEFPSDGWEHWDRVFSWDFAHIIPEHGTRTRFAYFWNWTWLGTLPLGSRFFGASVLTAFWQLAISYGFYRLLRRLQIPANLARVQVLAAVLFFGNSLFGIRYYALASMPMAYVFYLLSLVALIDALEGKWRTLTLIPLYVLGIYYNHYQELLFLAVAGTALVAYYGLRGRVPLRLPHPGWAFVVSLLLIALGTSFFRSWRPSYGRTWDALAVPGAIGVVWALARYRVYPAFTVLTAAPVFFLLFPPLGWIAVRLMIQDSGDMYRLLYTFPPAFAFGWAVCAAVERWTPKLPTIGVCCGLLLALSLVWVKPWRGRGMFQLYEPKAFSQLAWLHPTIEWFRANESLGNRTHCRLASDNVTTFGLRAAVWYDFALPAEPLRRTVVSVFDDLDSVEAFQTWIARDWICGLLLVDPVTRERLNAPASWIGRNSGHWPPGFLGSAFHVPDRIYRFAERLSQQGWKSQTVPPFYTLWLAPQRP